MDEPTDAETEGELIALAKRDATAYVVKRDDAIKASSVNLMISTICGRRRMWENNVCVCIVREPPPCTQFRGCDEVF